MTLLELFLDSYVLDNDICIRLENLLETDSSPYIRKEKVMAPPVFDDLYKTYKAVVFGFAYYLTQNRGEAEDLFQEAWFRIVKKMPDEIDKKSIRAWIFTIVSNLHKDMLRKKRIRRLFFPRKIKTIPKDNTLFPDMPEMSLYDHANETAYADMGRDIMRAIAGLPDRQRRVFVLKEVTGFQQTEISEILGVPLGTVKSLMHRAVKRLQGELSAYNPKKERAKCDVKTLSV